MISTSSYFVHERQLNMLISVFIITFNMSASVLIMCANMSSSLTNTFTNLRVVLPVYYMVLDRRA